MNLTFVRKYNRFLRKTDGIFTHNPLLVLGLALPLAVIPSYGLTAMVAVSAAMLICFVPTVFIASIIGKRVSSPWRVILYPLISCLLLILSRSVVQRISVLIFDTLGVYFSLICVNSLLMYSVEQVLPKKPLDALAFALRQWIGASLDAFLCAVIRELLATGSLWGITVLKDVPRLPVAQMALGGFILLGFLAAFCRLVHRIVLTLTLRAGAAQNENDLADKERSETQK